jgi:hypothetical protein
MREHRMVAIALLIAWPALALAEPAERVAVAKATSPAATFSARPAGTKSFEVLPADTELKTGDLLVTLPGAALESKNAAVALKSFADYDGVSPLPILETAFTLDDPKAADLAFTLDRGRVDVTNKKADGPAVVKVKFWDQTWTITLDTPGSRVALELCGRWPAGSRFKPRDPKKTGPEAGPVASLVLLVLKGSASVGIGEFTLGMREPSGPALLEWDSLEGARPEPKKLDKLPGWADLEAVVTDRGKKAAETVERFRAARAANPAAALQQFVDSKDAVEQRVALVTLGAQDELERLGKALAEAKTLEEWDFGITVIRHWLGRGPGQDQRFFDGLVNIHGYDRNQARNIVQLLFGFSKEELMQPETFDVMIEYIRSDSPAIRNLAMWHLVRVVPRGKDIPYKPNGTKADAESSYQAWRKLVPAGSLPPRDEKN